MRILITLVLIISSYFSFAFTTKQVSFKSDTLTLYGTLLLPDGNGPFPVMVFVHGSGPNDRDGSFYVSPTGNTACLYPGLTGNTVRTLKDLAGYFASRGIATFRYDKRTFTYAQKLDPEKISIYDFIADAEAAITFLRNDHGFNDVILAGHSQGAGFMPVIAARENITALVSLAGPASSIDTLVARQVKYIQTKCGDSTQAQAVYDQVISGFNMIRQGTFPNTPFLGAYPKFWKEWINLTDSTIINFNAVEIPKLFIHGTKDFNVPEQEGLIFRKKTDDDVFILPGINHLLTSSTDPSVAPELKDTIYYWLQKKNLHIASLQQKPDHGLNNIRYSWTPGFLNIQTVGNNISSVGIYDASGKVLIEKNNHGSGSVKIPFDKRGTFILRITTSDHLNSTLKIHRE